MDELLHCPGCREPVKPHWSICPVCETRLKERLCPGCGQPVKEKWKRCPECETPLTAAAAGMVTESASGTEDGRQNRTGGESLFFDRVCGIDMVYVPAGTFEMGDSYGQGIENELPLRRVSLDGFYMARHCVTQAQWSRLIDDNPARHQGLQLPVEQITWEQARHFAGLLTRAHQGRCHFDLPSEAQWEYAARSAGRQQLYAGGDQPDAVAWYAENSQGRTHPVGSKAPNGLGLYDMSGNVWEWCRDTYLEEAYQRRADRNPVVEDPGPDRVIRGGSFHLDAWSARCARRLGFAADFIGPGLGFRLAMQVIDKIENIDGKIQA